MIISSLLAIGSLGGKIAGMDSVESESYARPGIYWSGRTPNGGGAGGTLGNAKSEWIMG